MSEKNAKAVLSALAVYMERNPELRVLQALSNVIVADEDLTEDASYFIEDGAIASAIWRAMRTPSAKAGPFENDKPIGRM